MIPLNDHESSQPFQKLPIWSHLMTAGNFCLLVTRHHWVGFWSHFLLTCVEEVPKEAEAKNMLAAPTTHTPPDFNMEPEPQEIE